MVDTSDLRKLIDGKAAYWYVSIPVSDLRWLLGEVERLSIRLREARAHDTIPEN